MEKIKPQPKNKDKVSGKPAYKNDWELDLGDFLPKHKKVIVGRDLGEQIRVRSQIDTQEPSHEKITILVPKDVTVLSQSFLEELLKNVVIKLKENFYKKISFSTKEGGESRFKSDVRQTVDRIIEKIDVGAY
jgi:hypothetical protein